MSTTPWKAFAEVTAFAALLFAAPMAYYYGRPKILQVQEKAYSSVFEISEDQYKRAK